MVGLTGAALCFFIATFKGEENPAYSLIKKQQEDKTKAAGGGGGAGGAPAAASGGGGIWGMFGARSKEEAVGKAVLAGAGAAAANPSMGKTLFGGGDPEAPAYAPPKAERSAAATSAFASSGLFGGGSSGGGSATKSAKYGYGDDIPEANPFVS